jgi:hypothetical protein
MTERRFRKGDRVSFRYGIRSVQGVVTEDIGPIGVKGRHLYEVKFPADSYSDSFSLIELPAVQLELIKDSVAKE